MSSEDSSQSINERMAALRQRLDQEDSNTTPPPLPTPPDPDESKVSTAEPEKQLEPVERSMDAPRTGPLEVNYLSDDPSNIANAIELHFSTPESLREADTKRRRLFWGSIGGFSLVLALTLIMQNGWLVVLSVLSFILMISLGRSMFSESRKDGVLMIGSVLVLTIITLYIGYLIKPPEPVKSGGSDGGTYVKSLRQEGSDSYECPHCNGMGVRYNQITGAIGKCASCGGDGKVTGEQYDRLSK